MVGVPRLFRLWLGFVKRLTSIVRNKRLCRSVQAVATMSVESFRPTFRPNASIYLTFPIRSTLRIS